MQQVNLFQPMFRRHKKVFSAVTMLQILAFFIVILAAIYGYTSHKLAPFRNEIQKTDSQFEKLAHQIEVQRARFGENATSKVLQTQIARLTREVQQSRRLKDALSSGALGNETGFSSYFEALARGHVDGAWLTEISIANGGRQIRLSGLAIDPKLVPVYIQRLSESPVFRNRAFNVLEMTRSEKEPDLVAFNIATGS